MTPLATVVITTRNRKDELRGAIASALTQDVPVEVLVIDDGSTDGTPEMVAAEFPAVRLDRSPASRGYIVQRNRAADLAAAPVIVSIDDDARFTDPGTVRQALAELAPARAGALAMPFININQSPQVYQRAPDAGGFYARQWFIGTAHAIKRDVFKQLGGYREFFYSQVEEFDFALRLLDAGYVVRVGSTKPVEHLQSPRRVQRQIVHYGERNRILLSSLNAPLGRVPMDWGRTVTQGLCRSMKQGFMLAAATGLGRGMVESLRYWPQRRPVSRQTYRRWRAMDLSGDSMTLAQLDGIG